MYICICSRTSPLSSLMRPTTSRCNREVVSLSMEIHCGLFTKACYHGKLSYITGGVFIEVVVMGDFTILLNFTQVEL